MTLDGALSGSIKTARLRLRCVGAGDAVATSALMTREVGDWLASWPTPFTVDMATARISSSTALAQANNMMPLAIIERKSDSLLGWVIVNRDVDEPRRGHLGYWMGRPYQGQGYMAEAVVAVLKVAFQLLDLDIIEAGAQVENAASFAVMRACGMRDAGERMVHAPARQRDELCRFYEIRAGHGW